MLTDLTENLIQKKTTFYVPVPYGSDGVFERVSAFWVHPLGFYLEKANIDENIRGESFVLF